MKRKKLFLLSLLAILSMLISNCAPGPQAPSTEVATEAPTADKAVLNIVLSSYWQEDWWKRILDGFSSEHPEISIEYWFGSDWTEYTQTKISAGEPPDLFWLTRYEWIDNGLVMDLTDALQTPPYGASEGTWQDTFYTHPGPIKYKDRYWTVPWDLSIDGYIWYNVEMFEEYGKLPPKTWDELIQLCEFFKSKDIACFAQSNDSLYTNQWFRMLAQRIAGMEKIRATGSAERVEGNKWTDPEFLKAAEMAQNVAKSGYFISGYEGLDYHSAQVEFIQGRAAMMLLGNWLAGEMAEIAPPELKLDYVLFPQVSDGKGDPTVQITGTSDLILSATTKYPEELILFTKYLTSLKATTMMAEDSNLLYGTKGSTPEDKLTTFDKKTFQIMAELEDSFDWYAPPDFTPTFEMGDYMFNNTVSLMQLQITPQEFLQKLEEQMAEWVKSQ